MIRAGILYRVDMLVSLVYQRRTRKANLKRAVRPGSSECFGRGACVVLS